MQVAKDTVVAIDYELFTADGELIEKGDAPLEYLHGGYHGIFPRIEDELAGKSAGDSCEVYLQPDEAFGDYDAELVRIESRDKFPEQLEVGMRFEGEGAQSGETRVFTVTDIADGKVVVDGNHPLAGKALRFSCRVAAVRAATAEELAHGHVHGPHGHHH